MIVLVIFSGGGAFIGGAGIFVLQSESLMAVVSLAAGLSVFAGLLLLRKRTRTSLVVNHVLYTGALGQTALQLTGWSLHGPALIIYPILVTMGSVTLTRTAFRRYVAFIYVLVIGLIGAELAGARVPGDHEVSLMLLLGYGIEALFAVTLAMLIGNHARSAYEGANRERDESERRLRLAIRSAKVGVWAWSARSDEIEISPSLAEMLQLPADAPLRWRLAEFAGAVLPPAEVARVSELARQILATGNDAEAVFRTPPSRGGRWLHVDLTTELAGPRRDRRIVGAARDITREHLEQERRSQFIASMSHELRTPLNGVLGMAELMDDGELPPTHRRRLHMVLESGYHMLATINDVLDFERIEAGAITLTDVETDLRKLVSSLLTMFAPSARERQLRLSAWVESDVPDAIAVDSVRLSQILVNLIGNALKYTDDGSVQLRVSREPETLAFSVTDTGVGIPDNRIHEIFQPFERIEPGTRRRRDGQGLGLAISLRLAQLLDGTLDCTSAPGEGSTFVLRLHRTTEARPRSSTLKHIHALVRSDSEWASEVVCRTLRESGATAERVDTSTVVSAFTIPPSSRETLVFITPHDDADLFAEQFREAHPSALLVAILRPEQRTPPWADGDIGCPVAQAEVTRIAETLVHAEARLEEHDGGETTEARLAERYPMKLMVVEDDPISRLVASGLFEREGYDVRVAPGGDEAVEAFEQDPVDLILMDLHMPKVDGLDATRAIRALDRPQPVIIAYTADADASVLARLTDAGADGVLLKPTRREHMVALLRAVHRGDITPRHPTLWTASPADAQAINDATPPP